MFRSVTALPGRMLGVTFLPWNSVSSLVLGLSKRLWSLENVLAINAAVTYVPPVFD